MTLTEKIVNRSARPEPRKRRLPEAARENILSAAEALLIAEGPQSLKLVDVARQAQVSNASVLHHFGSIGDVQTALMERMVRQLVQTVLAASAAHTDDAAGIGAAVTALFDAFEARGAARLAAWLELTGEARRLTVVRAAVREVIDADVARYPGQSREAIETFTLVCIATALGVGLFGQTLGVLLGRPATEARDATLAVLIGRLVEALAPSSARP